jgi:hypothetical protein
LADFRGKGITDSTLQTRKPNQENRPGFAGLFHGYRPVVVVDDLADNGKAEARAIGLP